MKLSKLKLENFRGFEDLEITFEEDLTVLVGANGAGKTSIIDAISDALADSFPVSNQSPLWSTDKRVHTQATLMRLRAETSGHPLSFEAAYPESGLRTSIKPPADVLIDPVIVYTVARNTMDLTSQAKPSGKTVFNALIGWQDAGASFEDFFSWFKDMEDLENEAIRYEKATEIPELTAVRQALTTLLPEFSEIRIRRDLEPYASSPVLALTKGGHHLPFNSFSEGERSTLAMVADIARRLAIWSRGRNPLEQEATVIIDEFELHLHPAWQRQMISGLHETFPNVQFILTTHSPIVVSEVESRQLRVLKDFKLVETDHGPGRDANAVLEDVFEVPARPAEVQEKIDLVANSIDDDRLDEAEQALKDLQELLGGQPDPDVAYYSAILQRLRLQ